MVLLFIVVMMFVVYVDDLVLLFIGWEVMGLCFYFLLIVLRVCAFLMSVVYFSGLVMCESVVFMMIVMIWVLFVEDDVFIVELFVCALWCEGYEVDVCFDGFGVFVGVGEGVDLVVFDFGLFGMDGLDVCCELCV